MKEPGLDNRHRDKPPSKDREIHQKRGDTTNKNLPEPIKESASNTTLGTMRPETGEESVKKVQEAAGGRSHGHREERGKRWEAFGMMKGQITLMPGFDEPLDDFKPYTE